MKHLLSSLLIGIFLAVGITACKTEKEPEVNYQTVEGDPLNARIYTLDNGMKVYLTVYKEAPRIQTYIAIGSGSKNDPHTATGLAHYLEHMLFKGTDKYGTLDYAKEEPLLNQIDSLYEVYRSTTNDNERKQIYHIIDSVSGEAAKFAIANEYDKMVATIGAKGTNAYTSVERTVYMNDIPSNQLKKWLDMEYERFRKPVFRLFHTELEAVYEEKNISLDSDDSKLWDSMFAGLFQKHTYGTQTTIGTIEHLKNPSLKEIRKFYDNNYVPANMAICMSGDFDPDSAFAWINERFGQFESKPDPEFTVPVEDPISEPIAVEVWGPESETVALGFRMSGFNSEDAQIAQIINQILYNDRAGLIDLNLNKKQKVIEGWSYAMIMKDYSAHLLGADAKEGQSLEDVKDLLLEQLEKVKKGEFEDWLLEAVINNMKYQRTKGYESNRNRAHEMVTAFSHEVDWKDYIQRVEQLSSITKEQIVDFANRTYNDNYVVVYKRNGEDENVQKVEKPEITPVETNREAQSDFLKELTESEVPPIEPAFIDYEKDISQASLSSGTPLLYKKNEENETFSMYYVVDMGANHMRELDMALDYLPYLGTSSMTADELSQEFYKIACSFNVSASNDRVYVSVSGLSDNFDKAVELLEGLLADAQPNEEALANLIDDELKQRSDDKLSKDFILWDAMYNYGVYGAKNPLTNMLSQEELTALKAQDLANLIQSLTKYEHRVLYYGSKPESEVAASLNKLHAAPEEFLPLPEEMEFPELATEQNQVYVVDYDMKQAEILMLSKGKSFAKDEAPQRSIFNEYFGGGMSSIVFQEMRESKALAYSVFSAYRSPSEEDKAHYVMAYIGTQADKLPEAMAGMNELLTEIPQSEVSFNAAKEAVIQKIRTERITKSSVFWNYERARKLGMDYDVRKDVFEKVPSMTMGTVEEFFNQNVKDKKYNILVLGDKDKLDMATLEQYGPVKFLTLEEVFGY